MIIFDYYSALVLESGLPCDRRIIVMNDISFSLTLILYNGISFIFFFIEVCQEQII